MRMQSAVTLILALVSTSICSAETAPSINADDVITKVTEHNSQREQLGGGYTGTRRYVLENDKFGKRAEMLVSVRCDPDGTKHFEVLFEDGWKSANRHVIHKMLESESETSQPQIRRATSLTPENYRFQMLGSDVLAARLVYVIQVLPRREDKYLFEGQIWVDAEDFAIVRIEGKPAKNPSFWTRSVHFVQQYRKSSAFWFPYSTESVTEARIFGKTEVTISYFDYQPNSSTASLLSKKTDLDRIEANHDQN